VHNETRWQNAVDAELFPKVNREIRTALEIIAAAKSDLLLACEKQREEWRQGGFCNKGARCKRATSGRPFVCKSVSKNHPRPDHTKPKGNRL
jgi:hypothetical protein